jgi:hypothetical protein
MRTYKTEFPEFADEIHSIVAQLRAAGWLDESWHNDVSARFLSADRARVLWVDHLDPDKRETMGPRFLLQSYDAENEQPADDVLAQFEEWEPMRAFLTL